MVALPYLINNMAIQFYETSHVVMGKWWSADRFFFTSRMTDLSRSQTYTITFLAIFWFLMGILSPNFNTFTWFRAFKYIKNKYLEWIERETNANAVCSPPF